MLSTLRGHGPYVTLFLLTGRGTTISGFLSDSYWFTAFTPVDLPQFIELGFSV